MTSIAAIGCRSRLHCARRAKARNRATAVQLPDEDAVYSQMQAESIEVTRNGPALGEITSRGQLVDAAGRRLAGFVQRTMVCQGSRVIRLDLELEIAEQPGADPWNSYVRVRFAWSDALADLFRAR